jgi:hypothetical protein
MAKHSTHTIADLVDALGGQAAVSRKLGGPGHGTAPADGPPPSTIGNYKQFNAVADYTLWQELVDLAQREGVTWCTADWLVRHHARKPSASHATESRKNAIPA